MNLVFMDTVGLLAVWDNTDQWHLGASRALDEVISRGDRTITSTFVLLECGNAASRRRYRHLVDQTRNTMAAGGKLIVPTESDWDQAWSDYRSGNAGDAGIVDYVSFIIMRRLGITDAFTNDRHFKAAGFNTLF
ncbi:MAG TPA: hypothetical protein VIM11_08220 [Tepidisphaeraceae bacterium]|jgi:predicted nucleic acid-binding protein